MNKELSIFLSSDQPETCRQCGCRTEFDVQEDKTELHKCPDCDFTYILEHEED
jgi:predicted Zn-ribbon and HTH transcriptional regulator